jgi:hypothetical protein
MKPLRIAFLIAAACAASVALNAQITLSTLVGTTKTPLGASYNFGSFAPNAASPLVTFTMTNIGTSPVTVCGFGITASGPGLTFGRQFTVNSPTPSYGLALAPDFFVQFVGGPVGNYTATLAVYYVLAPATCSSQQASTPPVTLTATVVQAGTLTVASPCTGPDTAGTISFGRIPQTQTVTCTVTVRNSYTQALTVSPITVTGPAFKTTQTSSASIPAGQTLSFTIVFTAAAATAYSGSLTVGVQTYALSGAGFLNPLPTPILSFGAATLQSGSQYLLTATLPSPAQSAISGTIVMGFNPSSTTIHDDTAVQFVSTSNRVVPFTVDQGSTILRLNGQTSAVFSTGTTAGTVTFKVDAGTIGISGNAVTSWTIDAAPVSMSTASASRGTTSLTLTLTGFDNTYSVGRMSFSFYDRGGKQIGSTIDADFTQNFQVYYQTQNAGTAKTGSAFQLVLTFPATGDLTTIGSMNVQLTNAVGVTTAGSVTFP